MNTSESVTGAVRRESDRLAGRRILITGGASGIGQATARLFARAGAKLALFDRNEAGLSAMARETGAFTRVVELTDEAQIVAAVAAAADALGGLDGLVNSAGIGGDTQPISTMTLDDWNRVIAVNLTAPFLITRECAPHLRAAPSATIVNISSGQGLRPVGQPGYAAYAASKGGLIIFSKTMASELAPTIRVNAIAPGIVDTPLLPNKEDMDKAAGPGSAYALQRVAKPEEIADSILFLSCDESAFITGTVLAVDGGRTFH